MPLWCIIGQMIYVHNDSIICQHVIYHISSWIICLRWWNHMSTYNIGGIFYLKWWVNVWCIILHTYTRLLNTMTAHHVRERDRGAAPYPNLQILFGKYFPIDPPLSPAAGLFFETETWTIFLNANFLRGHIFRFSSNIGVNPVIPPNGSNSSELKNRRRIPRF